MGKKHTQHAYTPGQKRQKVSFLVHSSFFVFALDLSQSFFSTTFYATLFLSPIIAKNKVVYLEKRGLLKMWKSYNACFYISDFVVVRVLTVYVGVVFLVRIFQFFFCCFIH